MAKSIFEELTGYRVKVERDGKEILNIPGILALPGLLAAPKAGVIGLIAAPLLGCNIHLENKDGEGVDIGKAVKDAADAVADTANTAARTIKEEIEKAWDAMSADDPEGCPEGEENEEEDAPAQEAEAIQDIVEDLEKQEKDDVPTIQIDPEDSDEE